MKPTETRECITHHICDCKAAEMLKLQEENELDKSEIEKVGRFCETLGLDLSNCYDMEDTLSLINNLIESERAKNFKMKVAWARVRHEIIEKPAYSSKLAIARFDLIEQTLKESGE